MNSSTRSASRVGLFISVCSWNCHWLNYDILQIPCEMNLHYITRRILLCWPVFSILFDFFTQTRWTCAQQMLGNDTGLIIRFAFWLRVHSLFWRGMMLSQCRIKFVGAHVSSTKNQDFTAFLVMFPDEPQRPESMRNPILETQLWMRHDHIIALKCRLRPRSTVPCGMIIRSVFIIDRSSAFQSVLIHIIERSYVCIWSHTDTE